MYVCVYVDCTCNFLISWCYQHTRNVKLNIIIIIIVYYCLLRHRRQHEHIKIRQCKRVKHSILYSTNG